MSFQQGLSGLNASSKNLDVIGNNIANANTFGAKASRAEFADVYANALNGTGSTGVGIGVNVAAVAQQFTQGNISTTDNPLDLAINGGGFFQVSNVRTDLAARATTVPQLDGVPQYSRNGQFKVDKNGYIVNNQSQVLLGYGVNAQGVLDTSLSGPLRLPTGGIQAAATSSMALQLNLDSRAGVITTLPGSPAINFSDPTTYNSSTSMAVYDSNGRSMAMTYFFQKTGNNTWDVYASANGASLLGAAPDPTAAPRPVASVRFPIDGGSPVNGDPANPLAGGGFVTYYTAATPTGAVTATNQVSGRGAFTNIPPVTLADGVTQTNPISGIGIDLSRLSQYGAPFAVTDLSQNGNRPGDLVGVNVSDNGVLMARYSNGVTRAAGQIELAHFRNPQGLQPLGGNAWGATFESGQPVLNTAGNGNMGVLQAGALEESNVDLTAELVNMITAQRAYQANAQTIKTQDQVLQTLVNLR